jgi:hypothetical protein
LIIAAARWSVILILENWKLINAPPGIPPHPRRNYQHQKGERREQNGIGKIPGQPCANRRADHSGQGKEQTGRKFHLSASSPLEEPDKRGYSDRQQRDENGIMRRYAESIDQERNRKNRSPAPGKPEGESHKSSKDQRLQFVAGLFPFQYMNEDFLPGRIFFGTLFLEDGSFAGLNPAAEVGHRSRIGGKNFQRLAGLHLVDFFLGLHDWYWALGSAYIQFFHRFTTSSWVCT